MRVLRRWIDACSAVDVANGEAHGAVEGYAGGAL